MEERDSGKLGFAAIRQEREKRGDLTQKMESVLHTLVESMAVKVPSATLSQTAVAAGILTDKIRILRGQGLEPDPALELCRLLGINRSQLPPTLELEPGEQIDQDVMDILELKRNPDGSFQLPNETTEKCSDSEAESQQNDVTPREEI